MAELFTAAAYALTHAARLFAYRKEVARYGVMHKASRRSAIYGATPFV